MRHPRLLLKRAAIAATINPAICASFQIADMTMILDGANKTSDETIAAARCDIVRARIEYRPKRNRMLWSTSIRNGPASTLSAIRQMNVIIGGCQSLIGSRPLAWLSCQAES